SRATAWSIFLGVGATGKLPAQRLNSEYIDSTIIHTPLAIPVPPGPAGSSGDAGGGVAGKVGDGGLLSAFSFSNGFLFKSGIVGPVRPSSIGEPRNEGCGATDRFCRVVT